MIDIRLLRIHTFYLSLVQYHCKCLLHPVFHYSTLNCLGVSKYELVYVVINCIFPQIPFYPVVRKDLTFIHLGNDSRVEDLVNFEKLRMIAKEVRALSNMCSSPYDLLTMLELGGQPASNAMVALNQLTTASSQHHPQGRFYFRLF